MNTNEFDAVPQLTAVQQEIADMFHQYYTYGVAPLVSASQFVEATTPNELLEHHEILALRVGDMVGSKTLSGHDFIALKTKVGVLILLQENGRPVEYRCDAEYPTNLSAQEAGFKAVSGRVESPEQMRHFIKVASSYKQSAA
jgi:hypothetical protein